MRPERWSRIRELFERASTMEEPARSRFLSETTADDPQLRIEVERLLESGTNAEFLEPPDPARLAASLEAPRAPTSESRSCDDLDPGTRLGSYRILNRIGRGGMGTVFAAEQDRPHRRVALKVLRDPLGGSEVRRRFLVEAELLGRLRHPGIATVFEVGEEVLPDGRTVPFFALELVEGARDLIGYSNEQGLDLRARIALLQEVLMAVHHGHLAGVVHRDLKPDNLLVDRDGRPKVIDYGVACAVDPALTPTELHSQGVHVVGTLQYMAPEQLRGGSEHLDHRADVYALGLVLYELISGARPYDLLGKPLTEVLEQLASERRPPPSEHNPGVPRELDWICLRAIASPREDRYTSAEAFSEDLERFFAGEVVRASPPGGLSGALYRTRKFVARHRLPLGVLALVLAGLSAAVFVIRSALVATQDERDRNLELVEDLRLETEERQAALHQLELTNKGLVQARVELEAANERTLLELARQETVTESLHDLLSAVDPDEDGYRVTLFELLQRARPRLDRGLEPGHEALLAAFYASAYRALGMQERALELYRQAREALAKLPEPDPALSNEVDLWLAYFLILTQRTGEADPLMDGVEDRLASTGDRRHEAELVRLRSMAAEQRGALESAVELIETAFASWNTEREENSSERALMSELRLRSRRGLLLLRLGRLGEGVDALESAYAGALAHLGPRHSRTFEIGSRLTQGLSAVGRTEEALELQAELCAGVVERFGTASRVNVLHLSRLMTAYLGVGDVDEALVTGERALDAIDLGAFEDAELELTLRSNYAVGLGMAGRGEESVVELERAVELLLAGGQAMGARMFDVRQNLAEALFTAGRLGDAVGAFEESLFLAREVFGKTSWQAGLAKCRMGMMLMIPGGVGGDPQEGLELLRDGHRLLAATDNELGRQRRVQIEASAAAFARGLADQGQLGVAEQLTSLINEWR